MSTRTAPSGLSNVAPTGQTCVHGECAHWLHSFGTKKLFALSPGAYFSGKPLYAAVRRVDLGMIGVVDVVALDPGAEVEGVEGHVVLGLAGAHAVAAADALVDVDDHSPEVIRHPIGGLVRLRLALGEGVPIRGGGRGQHEDLAGRGEEFAAVLAHFFGSLSGACWSWQVRHGPPSMCVFGSICGNFAGLATFVTWHVRQSVFAIRLHGLQARRVRRVLRRAPRGRPRSRRRLCLPPFQRVALFGVALDARRAAGEDDRPSRARPRARRRR